MFFVKLVLSILGWLCGGLLFISAATDPELYRQGRFVYSRHCVVCHGVRGDGKGEMSVGMFPKPRPFMDGVFKYRSTGPGMLPIDDDLKKTISTGLVGTSMPAFVQLSARELSAVVEYIKGFSPRWGRAENVGRPVTIPRVPLWFERSGLVEEKAKRGGELYKQACSACHGTEGDGKGVSAAALRDDWGEPSIPTDLRQKASRVGNRPEDLYRVLLTGIGGSPMPSFAEAFSEEDRWMIVAWLLHLRTRT